MDTDSGSLSYLNDSGSMDPSPPPPDGDSDSEPALPVQGGPSPPSPSDAEPEPPLAPSMQGFAVVSSEHSQLIAAPQPLHEQGKVTNGAAVVQLPTLSLRGSDSQQPPSSSPALSRPLAKPAKFIRNEVSTGVQFVQQSEGQPGSAELTMDSKMP